MCVEQLVLFDVPKTNINVGSRHPRAKLSDEDVLKIKELLACGRSQYFLARKFKVSQPLIAHIASGRRWSHI